MAELPLAFQLMLAMNDCALEETGLKHGDFVSDLSVAISDKPVEDVLKFCDDKGFNVQRDEASRGWVLSRKTGGPPLANGRITGFSWLALPGVSRG